MAKPAPPLETPESKEHFFEVLDGFDTAILVTRPADGSLHARPLTIAGKDSDGTLWFVTSIGSPKIEEVVDDKRALVTMQSERRFVTLEGDVSVVRDRTKVEELWSLAHEIWFENKDDPDIALVRFSPFRGEYWDNAGAQGVRFALRAAKAVLQGEPLTDRGDPKAHGKVTL